jgi:hypothetical protein
VKTWLKIKFVDSDLIQPENLLGLGVLVSPNGNGAVFETRLDKIYKTPSKNPNIISSELPREDFPIYMNKTKDAYITVQSLMNSIKDGKVEFWYKGNE